MLTFGTIRLLNFSRISEEVDEIHQHIYPRYQQTLQRQKRYKNWKQNVFGNRSLKRTEIMIFRILFTSYFLFFELIVTRALGSTPAGFV
jgi:hypothetical protein